MCGRFVLAADEGEFTKRFGLMAGSVAGFRKRYNAAPGQELPVIVLRDQPVAVSMRCGLIPGWADDASIASRIINARAETVAVRPAFRRPFVSKRCIVPASGFYEWKRTPDGNIPMYIARRDSGLIGLAGLWDEWEGRGAAPVRSFTIITVSPNVALAAIHDRMPAILRRDDESEWLVMRRNDPKRLRDMLVPYDEAPLTAYAVSPRVNNPTYDAPDLIEPRSHGRSA